MKTTLDDFNFSLAIQAFLEQGPSDFYALIDYLQERNPDAPFEDFTIDERLDYFTTKYNLQYSEHINYTIYCPNGTVEKR